MRELIFEDWGLVDYKDALARQEAYLEEVAAEKRSDTIIFCTHPPVVTLGRATKEGDVTAWNGQVYEISRGGRATYHGPSQLVIYLILNLNFPRHSRPVHDVTGFLRDLENSIIQVLADYGLEAEGKSLTKKINTEGLEETGVWVGGQKIASLGIGVRKWITFHGAAINLEKDPTAFQGMKPCGFQPQVMTSLEEKLGHKIDRHEFSKKLKHHVTEVF